MSTTREKIFTAIRSALASLPQRTLMPEWEDDLAVYQPSDEGYTLKSQFADKLKEAGDTVLKEGTCSQAFFSKKKFFWLLRSGPGTPAGRHKQHLL